MGILGLGEFVFGPGGLMSSLITVLLVCSINKGSRRGLLKIIHNSHISPFQRTSRPMKKKGMYVGTMVFDCVSGDIVWYPPTPIIGTTTKLTTSSTWSSNPPKKQKPFQIFTPTSGTRKLYRAPSSTRKRALLLSTTKPSNHCQGPTS